MSDPRDYKLDLSSGTPKAASDAPPADASRPAAPAPRPFVSVHFACCNVYLRIYRSADGKSYQGRCPRCGVAVYFAVGQGGTDSRSFVVR